MLFAESILVAQQPVHWVPESFEMAVASTIVFGGIGIVLAILGFKLFDLLTPGKLDVEILEKQNVAASILGAAIILGICLVVSAAIRG